MMVEEIVIGYLNSNLNCMVFAEKPKDKPDRYVIVEKTGGGIKHGLCHSVVAIQSIVQATPDNSRYDAAKLNEAVKEAMIGDTGGILTDPYVVGVELNSDYNFTDPDSNEYRYQAVYNINHY